MECGQSTGATYPCLMLSRTRLKRVNILSGAFTIHLGTFYTSDGWDDSLPGSCQTVPEYMYINFRLFFDRKPRGKWRQWRFGEAKKEAKIGFAAAQMARRKEDQRQTAGAGGGKKIQSRKLGPSVQSLVGNKTFEESRVSWSRGGGAECVSVRCLAGSLVTRGAALRTALRSLANPLLCRRRRSRRRRRG